MANTNAPTEDLVNEPAAESEKPAEVVTEIPAAVDPAQETPVVDPAQEVPAEKPATKKRTSTTKPKEPTKTAEEANTTAEDLHKSVEGPATAAEELHKTAEESQESAEEVHKPAEEPQEPVNPFGWNLRPKAQKVVVEITNNGPRSFEVFTKTDLPAGETVRVECRDARMADAVKSKLEQLNALAKKQRYTFKEV